MAKQKQSQKIRELQRRIDDLEKARNRFRGQWQEIAKYITPGRGIFDDTEPNVGERRDRELLDATPFQALTTLAAGMQGGLTSPSRPWFKLGVTDPELGDYEPVRVWLDEVERRMLHVMGRSNVYNCLHTLYSEVGAFGTGAIYIEEDPTEVIRCTSLTAGEYSVSFDSRGMPAEFARSFWMSAAQLADKFDEDDLSDAVKNALEGGRRGDWFRVHHLIFPNDQYSPLGKVRMERIASAMPWASVYWESGKDHPLRVSGYEEFPVLVPRWDVLGSDYYGRGPGWAALGESKMLQELRHDYLGAQKLSIKPPLMGPSALQKARANLSAGAVTYYDGEAGFQPIYQVRPDIPGQLQAITESRELIQRFFYADLFLMLAQNDTRDMTAREVAERHEEKMLMLGPVLERLENELLDPLIERVFAIMDRMGLLPSPPEDLGGKILQVEYISILAQAQRMVGIDGIERMIGFVGGYAQLKPEVLDKIDFDETIDQYAKKLGVPASVIVSDENVALIRKQRAEQQAQMEQMAAMQQAAQTAQQGAGAVNQISQAAAGGGLNEVASLLGMESEEMMANEDGLL